MLVDPQHLKTVADDSAERCAAYSDAHNLFDIMDNLLHMLVVHRPDDPLVWAADYLDRPDVPSIAIIAPPAAYEVPLCAEIARRSGAVIVQSKNVVLSGIERRTPMGIEAMPYFARGEYIPDNVMLEIMLPRLAQRDVVTNGYILTGFPRTQQQLSALKRIGWAPRVCIIINITDSELMYRASRAVVDPVSGATYDLQSSGDPGCSIDDAAKAAGIPADVRARLVPQPGASAAAVDKRIRLFRRGIYSLLKNSHTSVDFAAARRITNKLPMAFDNTRESENRPSAAPTAVFAVDLAKAPRDSTLGQALSTIGEVLRIRAEYVGPRSHRVVIVGSLDKTSSLSQSQLHNIGAALCKHYGIIDISLRKDHRTSNEICDLVFASATTVESRRHGWVLVCGQDWTNGEIEEALKRFAVNPARCPTRVLYLHTGPVPLVKSIAVCERLGLLESSIGYPKHPWFNKADPVDNVRRVLQKLQCPADEMPERARCLLLRPADYENPLL